MPVLGSDFTDNTVFIYDEDGNHLIDTIITNHDKHQQQIQVSVMPMDLKVNDNCKLLVLSSPSPCEYHGKVKKFGGNQFIAMYQGQEKEDRGAARYPVTTPALITAKYVRSQLSGINPPLKVTMINISTSGVRFRAPYQSLEDKDRFQMYMVIANNKKQLISEVINHMDYADKNPKVSDYGCRFVEL